jgi:methyl-accepting chemotaxis protein
MNLKSVIRFQDWPLNVKLTTFTLAMSLGALGGLGIVEAVHVTKSAQERATDTMRAVMLERAQRVENEFTYLQNKFALFASDTLVTDAATAFIPAFDALPAESKVTPKQASQGMTAYFDSEYRPRLTDAGVPYRGSNTYLPANPAGQIAQAAYISSNPSPVGSKHEFEAASEETAYNTAHAEFHSSIRGYLDTFDAYDIFIVNPTGDIVYSVFKEADYATNLRNGPYSTTNLAEAFNEGLKLSAGHIYTTDYAFYEPSYGAPAIFMSSPIFSNGTRIGVACIQMPVQKIDPLVAGTIGKTGHTWLVSNDQTLRSAFKGSDKSVISTRMESEAAKLAAGGESGDLVQMSDSGTQTLAVFAPLNVPGLDWGIVGEYDMAEVIAPATAMKKNLAIEIFIAMAIIIPLAFLFSRSFVRPILRVVAHTQRLAAGDFSQRLNIQRKDELGKLAEAADDMTAQIGSMISDVSGAAHEVAGAATQIAATSEQMSRGLDNQEQQTNESSAAVEELSSSIASVADKSAHAAQAAANAGAEAEEGGKVVADTISEIRGIAQQVRQSVQAVDALGVKSEAIGEIIAVINDIADQTNLLALNAAIEAARAGEHGRGFAVVADEVRKLAERTTTATEQVSKSIREIQNDTQSAIEQIEQGSSRVENGVKMASNAGGSLERIVEASKLLQSMVDDIAHAIEEQTIGAQQIAEATSSIVEVTRESASAASEANSAASNLSQQAERLLSMTSQFTV